MQGFNRQLELNAPVKESVQAFIEVLFTLHIYIVSLQIVLCKIKPKGVKRAHLKKEEQMCKAPSQFQPLRKAQPGISLASLLFSGQ